MKMPDGFEFSQTCLQDYLECARRFWLKFIEQRAWPAEISQPAYEQEQHMLQGQYFHRLVQQHLLGIPVDQLQPYASGDELSRWWGNYLANHPDTDGCPSFVEYSLSMAWHGYRLVAKYDLIILEKTGSVTIVDWKTNHKRPGRERLSQQMQTHVYPYLLAQAGDLLTGMPLQLHRMRMVYWFANFPEDPEIFDYSRERFTEDGLLLDKLGEEILGSSGMQDFPLVSRIGSCPYCVYRSYCDRGEKPGEFVDMEEETEAQDHALAIDFESILESEY